MALQAPIKSGSFLKAADFNGEGKTLVVTKAPEEVKANDPKYGRAEDGMTINYYFEDKDGAEYVFQNHGAGFGRAFNAAKLNVDDVVVVKRSGEGYNSKYTITKA